MFKLIELCQIFVCIKRGYTALMIASTEGHAEVVKLLLACLGVGVDLRDKVSIFHTMS